MKKYTKKEGTKGSFCTVSTELDDTKMAKTCYSVEPRKNDMTDNDVYDALKSNEPFLPSDAAPLFESTKKLAEMNNEKNLNDNQPLNWKQTTQQVTEQAAANDDVDKSGIIECSFDNDETYDSKTLGLCNEIEVLNEEDGSVTHHGNEMKEKDSSTKSDKTKDTSEKLICEPFKTNYIDCDFDFFNDIDYQKSMREFEKRQKKGRGGLRTEFYDMKPETPIECDQLFRSEYSILKNDKVQTESKFSKVETPMSIIERPETRSAGFERPQTRIGRPERPQTRLTLPETHQRWRIPEGVRDDFLETDEEFFKRCPQYRQLKKKREQKNQDRPDSQESTSSLEYLALEVVKKVVETQERICKYLSCIYDKICEPNIIEDIHDFGDRIRRSIEYTNLFVRNHLYQIGRLAENIRVMSRDNPINIVTKVNALFQLILQALQNYLRNMKGFIYNNSPDKLFVFTEYIVNAIKACFERRACSKQDKTIMNILTIIDDIRYCLSNCSHHGYLLKGFNKELNDDNHKIHHGILKETKENSKDSQDNSSKCSRETQPEKFKTLSEEDYNEKRQKKVRTFKENSTIYNYFHHDISCSTDKIWNNEGEERLKISRESSASSKKPPPKVRIQECQKEIPKKISKYIRKNIYGYPIKGPFNNSNDVPKAKPKANSNRSNLSSTKNSGSRLNSSKSSMYNHGLHPTKSEYCAPERYPIKSNQGLHPTKSTVYGTRLQSNRSTVQKRGSNLTKSTANGSTKSTVNGQLNIIGSEKELKSDNQSKCSSKSSMQSRGSSRTSGCSSVKSDKSSKIDKKSVKFWNY